MTTADMVTPLNVFLFSLTHLALLCGFFPAAAACPAGGRRSCWPAGC